MLSNSLVSVLNLLHLIIVVWLYEGLSLWAEVTGWSICEWHYLGHNICTSSQMVKQNIAMIFKSKSNNMYVCTERERGKANVAIWVKSIWTFTVLFLQLFSMFEMLQNKKLGEYICLLEPSFLFAKI